MKTDSRFDLPVPHVPVRSRTWFPILLGVLLGMVGWIVLCCDARLMYDIAVAVSGQPQASGRLPLPEHYWLYRTLLLSLAGFGGLIGLFFSQWPKKKTMLFLLATLAIIAFFELLGRYLDTLRSQSTLLGCELPEAAAESTIADG